jgi:flavin reductase (DIM6/NTAB) family NADH-FMN oxidoreductase RutF
MFYDATENSHGLRHDPFKAIVAPRPVGWISTMSPDGVCNIAPYSFFNAMSDRPHYVVFGSAANAGARDSLRNISETGEFVCSLATYDLRHQMNATSASVPYGVDEFKLAALATAPSMMVKPPRVKDSPVALECRHWQTIALPPAKPGGPPGYNMVIGLVVGIYIEDRYVVNGRVDIAAMQPIARLGYMDYSVVRPDTVFSIDRPVVDADGRVQMPKAAE